ncbi:hypothetical protein BC833DRAFT_587107 [Globomyces pollinis-pini]|nr:hypothetical protein BC833DRAFT_587107 [Globomyces pollinis-pini]
MNTFVVTIVDFNPKSFIRLTCSKCRMVTKINPSEVNQFSNLSDCSNCLHSNLSLSYFTILSVICDSKAFQLLAFDEAIQSFFGCTAFEYLSSCKNNAHLNLLFTRSIISTLCYVSVKPVGKSSTDMILESIWPVFGQVSFKQLQTSFEKHEMQSNVRSTIPSYDMVTPENSTRKRKAIT